ncbi:MAG: hypothetical protein WBB32_02340 [Flavobacteriales bacterium]
MMEPKIQVDMFEVGLGAALLLQFRLTNGQVVRVLADAGIVGGSTDRVMKRLPEALDSFDKSRRIDLIIGTHYDGDHLKGLPEIIRSDKFEFGEAWMPPVMKENGTLALSSNFLVEEMMERPVADVLYEHLKPVAARNRLLLEAEENATNTHRPDFRTLLRSNDTTFRDRRSALLKDDHAADLDTMLTQFESQLEDSRAVVDASNLHAEAIYGAPTNRPEQSVSLKRTVLTESLNGVARLEVDGLQLGPMHLIRASGQLRKSDASGAITAIHLGRAIEALKQRGVKAKSLHINNGEPMDLPWSAATKLFSKASGAIGLQARLLAPSKWLIEDLKEKIPISTFTMLRERLGDEPIPLKTVTPNNRLSYVVRFEHLGQGILVSGDAGCSDFGPEGAPPYYKDLLTGLMPLHVVQVAHHGGQNHHFYRVLQEAGTKEQKHLTHWLLSHAVNDDSRPSDPFRAFVSNMTAANAPMSLLFTSRPRREFVKDFTHLFSSAVGPDKGNAAGDVRLVYDSSGWRVVKHAVRPPQ